ncbi:hypothetical protein CRG98_024591 [Punica granatum]|uniref:non-specific serine/threonine protein kinase n=1 Tax=Punica granatum TaxID=22663 RepID=A0A2I0JFF1_PUNGR|nr:hypothetical protein CRG98_024591 [Punica granatum]
MESQLSLPHGRSLAATLWLLHSITAIALVACSMSNALGAHGNETDRLALLEFKDNIIVDPLGVLSSWNSSHHFCHWIPLEVGHLSRLRLLYLDNNSLSGPIPPSLSSCSSLLNISLHYNKLQGGQANDLDFLCSLTNATILNLLVIANNNFGGEVPKCIGNLSITLDLLALGQNALSGTLPSSIGNIINLQVLSVSANNFSGSIPPEIGNLKKMKQLYLTDNVFTGEVPHTLGNLSMLTHLSMGNNNLLGTIPSSLGKCQSLLALDLAHNKLAGAIPPEIMSLPPLSIGVDFSMNNLTGELPVEIGNLKHLSALDQSGNKLSGKIPSSLGSCMSLEYLYMGDNMFAGPIPSTLSSLRGIRELNLSHNRLSGQIPDFLEDLDLTSLDLSFNNFQGNLPTGGVLANTSATSVLGNEKLCGGLPEYRLPKCKSTGTSTNGRTTIAVKVLNLDRHGASKSFIKECEALRNIRHRNLVKVLTACSGTDYQGNDFKALVYEFMINGSLDEWLHPQVRTSPERETLLEPNILSCDYKLFRAEQNSGSQVMTRGTTNGNSISMFMFDTRPAKNDPCETPHWFFFDSIESENKKVSAQALLTWWEPLC